MKANKKFKEQDNSVSSVIGVILIVAITVAIAATVYVFVSVVVTPGSKKEPLITFSPDWDEKKLSVIKISIKDINWSEIQKGNSICVLPSGTIDAGDVITGCNGTVMLSYQNTTLLGSWEFT